MMVRPAVMHGIQEWAWGAPPAHALYETAAFGYYLGKGQSAAEALRTVEAAEALPSYWQRAQAPAAARAQMRSMMAWDPAEWM